MDPLSVALTMFGLKGVVSTVAGWRSGKTTAAELHQLAVRYWGCVVMEISINATNFKTSVDHNDLAAGGDGAWPIVDFTFSDALMPELAKLAPQPNVVVGAARVVAMQRQLAEMAALDRSTASLPAAQFSVSRVSIRTAWIENARKLLPMFFSAVDELKSALATEGRNAFGDEGWQQIEASVLPMPADS